MELTHSQSELKFFYQDGASHLFPEAWYVCIESCLCPRLKITFFIREEYIAPIPEAERHDMILAYHAQLNSVDDQTRLDAAKAWAKWECVTALSLP